MTEEKNETVIFEFFFLSKNLKYIYLTVLPRLNKDIHEAYNMPSDIFGRSKGRATMLKNGSNDYLQKSEAASRGVL